MKKPISGPVLKALREQRQLSQSELANAAKMSKDSISRLERGKQTGKANRTRETLAKALGVAPEVLTGEALMPGHGERPGDSSLGGRRHQLNIRVDGAVRNAFSLAALRYQIPIARIVELAPFLFVLAAERSLERRRSRLTVLEQSLDRAEDAARGFGYLPCTIAPDVEAPNAIEAERASIAGRDILAESLDDELFAFRPRLNFDYDPERHNPFVSSLAEMTTDPDMASIEGFTRNNSDFRVCCTDAMKLAGDNADLAAGILDGWAPLHEMPRELLRADAIEARVAWLREKEVEHKAQLAELLKLLD